MRPPKRSWPWLLIPPLLILIAISHHSIYEQNLARNPETGEVIMDVDGRPMTRWRHMNTLVPREGEHFLDRVSHLNIGVFLGLKSSLANILWVRVDSYFHSGRFDRIVPICYLITWLDPRFLEVYIIGAWHMAYNFQDPRYIPAGVEFLEKGIRHNPRDADLRFEQGHVLYDKAQQFSRAVERFGEANEMGVHPPARRHYLAHALEKDGRIDEAIAAWEEFTRQHDAAGNWQLAHVAKHNRDLTIWRKEARKLLRPQVVEFEHRWSVPKPRVLRIDGQTNLPEFTKVNVVLRDKNYDQLVEENPSLSYHVSRLTLFYDNLTVRADGRFSTSYRSNHLDMERLDLSAEPAKYPLTSDEYEVLLTINPRVQPIMVQDATGWNGEGITGPHVQEIDGVKIIAKMFTVTRAELLKQPQVSARDGQADGSDRVEE